MNSCIHNMETHPEASKKRSRKGKQYPPVAMVVFRSLCIMSVHSGPIVTALVQMIAGARNQKSITLLKINLKNLRQVFAVHPKIVSENIIQ